MHVHLMFDDYESIQMLLNTPLSGLNGIKTLLGRSMIKPSPDISFEWFRDFNMTLWTKQMVDDRRMRIKGFTCLAIYVILVVICAWINAS